MNNEIKLIIPSFHSITRSFSRKIQIKQFEPMDLFSSHNEQIPMEDATPEKIAEISDRLYNLAKEDVERDIKKYLSEPTKDSMDSEDLDKIAIFVAMFKDGKNKEELNSAIVSVKDKLNDKQLEFLRNLVKLL